MQTTKFLFVLGAAAVLANPLPSVAGPDSEAQAKMREALRQKMEELNATAAPAPAPVAPPVVIEPAPAPTPAPKPKPVVVEEVKPVARPATVVVPVPVEAPPVVVAPAPVAAPKVEKRDPRFSDVPDDTEAAQAAKLQEALRQKLAAEKASAPAPVVVAPVAPAKPVVTVAAPAPVVVAPITANIETAPSPLSGSKQERLAELLRRYKADEVTPQEYHTQRAKIIAEP
ncbi:MAG: hypothetical protein AAB370_07585 [Verrucomicrobiota bacterium]